MSVVSDLNASNGKTLEEIGKNFITLSMLRDTMYQKIASGEYPQAQSDCNFAIMHCLNEIAKAQFGVDLLSMCGHESGVVSKFDEMSDGQAKWVMTAYTQFVYNYRMIATFVNYLSGIKDFMNAAFADEYLDGIAGKDYYDAMSTVRTNIARTIMHMQDIYGKESISNAQD